MKLMVDKLREQQFPILKQKVNGKPIVYLDSACMSLKPEWVIEALCYYYRGYCSCHGRSVHQFSRKTTEKVEASRERIKELVNGASTKGVIFTKNATESLNLVANSLSLKKGDTVLTTDFEHNSNLLPWQILAKKGINHKVVESDEEARISPEAVSKAMTKDVKLVSMVHTSNITGATIPAREIGKIAKDNGALFMLDGAQSVPHHKVDVKKLGCDLLAFSGHKMCGPTGIGVLYGREDILEKFPPFIAGGETVTDSTYNSCTPAGLPDRLEGGLQHYAGIIGLSAACEFLNAVGYGKIESTELEITKIIDKAVRDIDGTHIKGPKNYKERGGITNLYVDGADAHDIASVADQTANIMIRSGASCVHSFYNARKLPSSVRASAYLYNNLDDAKIFAENIAEIVEFCRK